MKKNKDKKVVTPKPKTPMTWMDEWTHEYKLFTAKDMTPKLELKKLEIRRALEEAQVKHTHYKQHQFMQLYGGLSHGNRGANTSAHSSTSNITTTAGQVPITASAAAQQGALARIATLQALYGSRAGGLAIAAMSMDEFYKVVPKVPLKNVGTKFGEFIGWRMWYVEKGYLRSYSQDTTWFPKEPMTGTPSDHGNEGIWAFKDREKAVEKARHAHLEDSSSYSRVMQYRSENRPVVYGSIKLYGDVVEHGIGYRSSAAYISSLDGIVQLAKPAQENEALLEELRKRYLP